MSIPLSKILDNASEGTALTCTLSAESVQVIFFALSVLEDYRLWKEDYFDPVSDSEWLQIIALLDAATREILS